MRTFVKKAIELLPVVEPDISQEGTNLITFEVWEDDISFIVTVEASQNISITHYYPESPDEYHSELFLGDVELEMDSILYNDIEYKLTPHEWKELRKAVLNSIDTSSYDKITYY